MVALEEVCVEPDAEGCEGIVVPIVYGLDSSCTCIEDFATVAEQLQPQLEVVEDYAVRIMKLHILSSQPISSPELALELFQCQKLER